VAASLIAIVGIAAWAISLSLGYNLPSHNGQQEIVAQKGSKTRTLLPDGSTVWLNAGSKISYSSDFSGPVRHVTLQGEAFFDVVKQPDRPFIVHAADIDIKVLGTAFNVKSYDEDRTVETTLIRGLVSITRTNATVQQPILLHPNQKIVLQKTPLPAEESSSPNEVQAGPGKNFTEHVTQIDSNRRENELLETAWVYNRLEFRGDRFPDLARKLERWYNINIHFEDDAVRGLSFNGSLESETVDQAFAALKAAVPFLYEIKGNEIYVRAFK
jgi:ferric-dicitrate binding protein FerR (iron transport regulator)